jgi:hypothetical protein
MKYLNWRIPVILLLILALALPIFSLPVQATTGTATIYASSASGFVDKSGAYGAGYLPVQTAAAGATVTLTSLNIGQKFDTGTSTYNIYRGFLYFDTSTLPFGAMITAATIYLSPNLDNSVLDFNVTVQNGQPTYPASPLVIADYNRARYSGNGGTMNTLGLTADTYGSLPLNATGLTWINQSGTTKLCLRSDREIGELGPASNENVIFHNVNSTGTANDPKLVINYTTGVYGGANYYGTVTVSNNGTTASNVSVATTNLNSTSLIASGYLTTGANNTIMTYGGNTVPFMPGNGASPWMTWVDRALTSGYESYLAYFGNTYSGNITYFPGATGMVIPDAPDLELGNNFAVEIKGWVDTQASGDLVDKLTGANHAFQIYTDGTNRIKVTVNGAGATPLLNANVNSGNHIIRVTASAGNWALVIDGSTFATAVDAVSVTNSTDNWYVAENSAMPYMEYYKVWVGGVLVQHTRWNYGTTFTDLSTSANHTATPTFRTTSSSASVTGNLTAFLPSVEAIAPAYALNVTPYGLTAHNITSNFSSSINPTFPGADVVKAIAAASGTPVQLPFLLISSFVILAASLSLSYLFRRFQTGNGAVFIKIFTIAGGMGVCMALGIFDYWMILFFLIIAVAIGMGSRQQGWN